MEIRFIHTQSLVTISGLRTRTRFETEAKGNSEIAYYSSVRFDIQFNLGIIPIM